MISIGAAVAAGVSQGKSTTLGFDTRWSVWNEFRNGMRCTTPCPPRGKDSLDPHAAHNMNWVDTVVALLVQTRRSVTSLYAVRVRVWRQPSTRRLAVCCFRTRRALHSGIRA